MITNLACHLNLTQVLLWKYVRQIINTLVPPGPAWHSPDPATKLLPLAERPHADKSQRFLVTVTPESWNGSVRCYHPEMHAAEISVSRELARLAAAPEINIPKRKVDQWITKNEAETSVLRPLPSLHVHQAVRHTALHVPALTQQRLEPKPLSGSQADILILCQTHLTRTEAAIRWGKYSILRRICYESPELHEHHSLCKTHCR